MVIIAPWQMPSMTAYTVASRGVVATCMVSMAAIMATRPRDTT